MTSVSRPLWLPSTPVPVGLRWGIPSPGCRTSGRHKRKGSGRNRHDECGPTDKRVPKEGTFLPPRPLPPSVHRPTETREAKRRLGVTDAYGVVGRRGSDGVVTGRSGRVSYTEPSRTRTVRTARSRRRRRRPDSHSSTSPGVSGGQPRDQDPTPPLPYVVTLKTYRPPSPRVLT